MAFYNTVKMSKFTFEAFQLTANLASGITSADIGKAVTQDTSADNQVKLAGDGDPVIGVLYTVENRINEGTLVGTVEFKFAAKVPIKSGLTGNTAVARGKRLCGAGNGEVRALDSTIAAEAALIPTAPRVWSTDGAFAVATLF